jgi:paraquat-inducible protein B
MSPADPEDHPTQPGAPAPQYPEARVRARSLVSWIWVAPILAAAIVLWLAWRSLSELGPAITISFKSAEGLQEGQTRIRHKGVDIGTVDSLELARDMSVVYVHARMTRAAKAHLRDGTRFWIVTPRVGAGGISGLNTLVSGAYIEMYPGEGNPQRRFVGLDQPPTLQPDTPGRSFTLLGADLYSLQPGSPVTYRGIAVGEVEGFSLDPGGQQVEVYAFVRAPYERLVHPETRFWAASGIDVSAGAQGVRLRVSSWQQLLTGGVSFDTPEGVMVTAASRPGATFRLYDSYTSALRTPRVATLNYRIRLTGNTRGLDIGTRVELEGRDVGQVTQVQSLYEPSSESLVTQAMLGIDPGSVKVADTDALTAPQQAQAARSALEHLVQHGLRARLMTASFLTGQKLISLDLLAHAPRATLRQVDDVTELPTAPAADVDEILQSVQNTVQHLDEATAGPELRHALNSLDQSLTHLQHITADIEPQVKPLIEALRAAADAASHTAQTAGTLLGNQASSDTDLPRLMQQLSDAARSIRELADYLDRHPEALLRGRTGAAE